jgi:hypothetical protein
MSYGKINTEPDFFRRSKEECFLTEDTKADVLMKIEFLHKYRANIADYYFDYPQRKHYEKSEHGNQTWIRYNEFRTMSAVKSASLKNEINTMDKEIKRLQNALLQ